MAVGTAVATAPEAATVVANLVAVATAAGPRRLALERRLQGGTAEAAAPRAAATLVRTLFTPA